MKPYPGMGQHFAFMIWPDNSRRKKSRRILFIFDSTVHKRLTRGEYNASALIDGAGAFYSWAHQGKKIFCYFDNDEADYAVSKALKLHIIINS